MGDTWFESDRLIPQPRFSVFSLLPYQSAFFTWILRRQRSERGVRSTEVSSLLAFVDQLLFGVFRLPRLAAVLVLDFLVFFGVLITSRMTSFDLSFC